MTTAVSEYWQVYAPGAAGIAWFLVLIWLAMLAGIALLLRALLQRRPPRFDQYKNRLRRICRNCGALHLRHARYCPRCGRSV
jgi:uncharacterized paraquat-inducible protein A